MMSWGRFNATPLPREQEFLWAPGSGPPHWAWSLEEAPGGEEVGDVWFPAPTSAQEAPVRPFQLRIGGSTTPWRIRVPVRLWLAVWPQEMHLASLNLPGTPSPFVYFEV